MERKGGKGDTARHDTSYSILKIFRDPCILFASQLFCCLFSLSNVPFIHADGVYRAVFIIHFRYFGCSRWVHPIPPFKTHKNEFKFHMSCLFFSHREKWHLSIKISQKSSALLPVGCRLLSSISLEIQLSFQLFPFCLLFYLLHIWIVLSREK